MNENVLPPEDGTIEDTTHNLAFHANVCHVCKKTENLKRCTRCKIVAYCSKEHQGFDWKGHKIFCKAMGTAIMITKSQKVNSFDDMLQLKKVRAGIIWDLLKRELDEREMIMCMYPRFCEVCFTEDVQFDCLNCKNVFFCSETHRNEFKEIHKNHCDELKLCMETTLSLFRNGLGDTDFAVSDISSEILNLPDSLLDLLKLYDTNSNIDIEIIQSLMKLKCISPVASILYGLEKCGFLKRRLFHKNKLCVHIVGGETYEMGLLWKEMFELAFHWINNLIDLQFFIIGPGLNHNGSTDKFTNALCKSCKSKKASTQLTFHTQVYHNIVRCLKKPDVVVCFNSGLHLNSIVETEQNLPEQSWDESIKYLTSNNVPLIITAFTSKEIVSDIEEIKKHSKKEIQVLLKPQKNPFCDRIPTRDFNSQDDPVFYHNGYISVLKNK